MVSGNGLDDGPSLIFQSVAALVDTFSISAEKWVPVQLALRISTLLAYGDGNSMRPIAC